VAAKTKGKGGRRKLSDSDNSTQSDRAKENNVHRDTQVKLDKLFSLRPDLFARVEAGELTADGACREAGWVEESWKCRG
jgi:hypothetical protein